MKGNMEITVPVSIALSILLLIVLANILVTNKLREQNRKYEILSQICKEYLYEYFVKENRLQLSGKFGEIFTTKESFNQATIILKSILSNHNNNWPNNIIRLPLPGGEMGVFKVINSNIYDHRGRIKCIIGKLIDVSEETAEKEELRVKAQIDGLTGLYNAATTKELIMKRMEEKKDQNIDAFILVDCDGFKKLNDTYGHLAGNQVLEHVAIMMKQNFRNSDILGRIGGDEFCIYMKDIPSVVLVHQKCQELSSLVHDGIKKEDFSVSIGIVLVCEKEQYEAMFCKADAALYQAKSKGKAQISIYNI